MSVAVVFGLSCFQPTVVAASDLIKVYEVMRDRCLNQILNDSGMMRTLTELGLPTPIVCDCVGRMVASVWTEADAALAREQNRISPQMQERWPLAMTICADAANN